MIASLPLDDVHFGDAFQRFEPDLPARQVAVILGTCARRGPTIHDKGDGTVCSDPLAVVFACDVQVRGGGRAPFTGGMPDAISTFDMRSGLDPVAGLDMQVQDVPAGLFI